MATKPLDTLRIKIPGSDNTYVAPKVDATLAVAGAAADAKATGDQLTELKDDISTLDNTNDGTITPRLFAPNLLGKKYKTLENTYTDGYYIADAGSRAAREGMSIQEVDVVAGETYRVHTWAEMSPSATAYFGLFYTADNTRLAYIKNYITETVDAHGRQYNVTPPATAAKMYVNINTSEKQDVYQVYTDPSTQVELPDWMEQTSTEIWESIDKPFEFSGKTGQYFGDSIAYGTCSPNLGLTDSYIKRFCDSVGATILRAAVAGTSYADPENSNSILNKCLSAGNYPLFFVTGGVNDFITNKPIGAFGTSDTSTVYGAVKAICENFKNNHADATVIFITPIPLTSFYFTLHPELKYGNTLGYKLEDYKKAIYDVASSYGYTVVDGYSLGFPNRNDNSDWADYMCDSTDGIHPTVDGHKLLARSLKGKLLGGGGR